MNVNTAQRIADDEGGCQEVAIGASSAQSTAISSQARKVRLSATSACHISIGTNPTATASGFYLPANVVDYLMVSPGQKIAVIQESGAGSLFISEMI